MSCCPNSPNCSLTSRAPPLLPIPWLPMSSKIITVFALQKSKESAMDDAASSSWDGTLSSANEFRIAAHEFVDKWRIINPDLPPWSWVPCTTLSPRFASQVEGYLSLENMCIVKSTEEDHDGRSHNGKEELRLLEDEDPIDEAMLVQICSDEVHYYDFHIVYSTSYRVPVLYLRRHRSDGQTLVLEDIETDLPTHSAEVLLKSKWTFITQEEHPYLKRPWYKLHPCGTSEWMKLLSLANDASSDGVALGLYLMSWFSVVGQVVGLKISLEMLNKFTPL